MADKQIFFMGSDGSFLLEVPGLAARPVPVWEEGEDGRRRPTDQQEHDKQTNLPLWEQDCILQGLSFGQPSGQLVTVRFPSKDGKMPSEKTQSSSAKFFGGDEK